MFIKNSVNLFKEILYCAAREKLASCYEQSAIAELILRINCVPNCTKASLVSSTGKRLNHCVTCIIPKDSKKLKDIVVIDPWLQKTGYYNEMLSLYKNDYSRYFRKISSDESIILELHPQAKLSFSDLKTLVDRYPQLTKFKIKKEPFMK